MGTGHDPLSITRTLSGTTADTITLDQLWPFFQVTNSDTLNTIWLSQNGTTSPTVAVASAAGTIPILPLQTRIIQALPIQSGSGVGTIVMSIVGNGGAYTVTGLNTNIRNLSELDARYDLSGSASAAVAAVSLGFPTTSPNVPLVPSSGVAHSAANYAIYRRVHGSGTITALRVKVITQSGNVSVGAYAGTLTGISRKPGAAIGRSGSISCPAAGVADLAIGSSCVVADGDFFGISADNTTVSLWVEATGSFALSIGMGGGRMYYQDTAFPLPATATPTQTGGQSWIMDGV